VYFVRVDHIGRPVFATDAAGAKVWTASYSPFGEVHASTGTPIALRFPGQWFQSESGLHQNWMRDYDPTTGRYLQADPLGLVDGASVYGYVKQNPGRWIDPRGERGVSGTALGGSFGIVTPPVGLSLNTDPRLSPMASWPQYNPIYAPPPEPANQDCKPGTCMLASEVSPEQLERAGMANKWNWSGRPSKGCIYRCYNSRTGSFSYMLKYFFGNTPCQLTVNADLNQRDETLSDTGIKMLKLVGVRF
jgi:RHS repeat-associated protein